MGASAVFWKASVGFTMAVALSLVVGVLPASAAEPASAHTSPVAVPVTVLGGQGTPEGARPLVEVSVGNSRPVPVLLDTGSSGLHIFENAVETGPDSGVTLTSTPSNITYSGGHRFTGVVADAVVTIGSAATTTAVPFAYVQQAFCIATKPTCAASGGIPGFEQSGAFGILGIGMQSSGGGIVSPILGMSGALGRKWSLHLNGATGALTLGAKLHRRRAVAAIQMKQIGTSASRPLWADSRLPLCVAVGPENECVPGLFDSGTYSMQISGPELGTAPTTAGTEHVAAGTPVAIMLNGAAAPFWTFTSGPTKSENLLTVEPDEGPFVNTGVQAFYDFTIAYDDATGQIFLSQ
jgi:hypothetical protein